MLSQFIDFALMFFIITGASVFALASLLLLTILGIMLYKSMRS